MGIAYTNHIGRSARDKHSGKSTIIFTIKDLVATEKHNNHDYTTDDVSHMQSSINLDMKKENSQYEMKNGKLVKIEGHLDIEANVRKIYEEQFAEAVALYNEKQIKAGHPERQITSYIVKLSEDKQQEIAVEGVIQFGELEDWEEKSLEERKKVVPLLLMGLEYTINELKGTDEEFILAGASVHLNEGTPHLHYVGVPVQNTPDAKKGLTKRVKKSAVFTKERLGTGLQDNVRAKIEPELKRVFGWEFKEKKTGRNEDQEKRVYVNEKLKKQIIEKETEIEALKDKQKAITKRITDTTAEAIQELKQQVAKEVIKKPEQYEFAFYYFANCKQEEKERIITEGRKMIAGETENTRFIDEKINQALRAGNRTLSKEERSMLWNQYRERRDDLDVWIHTTSINIALAKEATYKKLSLSRKYLYNAERTIRHSHSLFVSLFAFTLFIIENRKIKRLQAELDDVKKQNEDFRRTYNNLKQNQRIAVEDLINCVDSAEKALKSMKLFMDVSDQIIGLEAPKRHEKVVPTFQQIPDDR